MAHVQSAALRARKIFLTPTPPLLRCSPARWCTLACRLQWCFTTPSTCCTRCSTRRSAPRRWGSTPAVAACVLWLLPSMLVPSVRALPLGVPCAALGGALTFLPRFQHPCPSRAPLCAACMRPCVCMLAPAALPRHVLLHSLTPLGPFRVRPQRCPVMSCCTLSPLLALPRAPAALPRHVCRAAVRVPVGRRRQGQDAAQAVGARLRQLPV